MGSQQDRAGMKLPGRIKNIQTPENKILTPEY